MVIARSIELFKEANEVMVGGVNSPVRSFVSVGGDPLVMARGQGAKLFDVDGNIYTDYCLSWGALILGHSHPEVMAAIRKSSLNGTSFGTTTRCEIELAQFIVRHVPSIEMIRFVNSGTEATMSAIRLARGFTKKNQVIKFDGCYHGHVDDLLTKAGSGVAKLPESSSLGVPKAHVQNTISLPYNNEQRLKDTIERLHDDIACVIIEPVAGNMGVVPAEIEFLKVLRYLTRKHGIILIFDEIMSGFRSSAGCVQSEINVIPDMTCLGKIIGGGFPVGAYGGRKDIMRKLAPLGGVYQAGTFSGNPVVLSAGLATLKCLNDDFYQGLNEKAGHLTAQLNRYFKQKKIPARLSSYHSMMSLRFRSEPVEDYQNAQDAASANLYSIVFKKLLQRGVYWPPADLEAFFLSGAHQAADLEELSKILKLIFKQEDVNESQLPVKKGREKHEKNIQE